MNLDIYYDAETDTLSLWNGVSASEAADIAEHLVADFDDAGGVVGFTLEHAGEVLKADLSVLARAYEDEIGYASNANGMTVIDKLKSEFPELYAESKADYQFTFRLGATIYVRKSKNGVNVARIHSQRPRNFPNGQELAHYVEKHRVPKDPSKSHPDYKFGLEHVDNFICILKGDME